MKKRFLCLFLTLLFVSISALGQQNGEIRRKSGPRRQLATIIFAGLGGAIFGLSTLSFYGRPQDNLSNIAIGFAVGVIAGTVYVTVKSATSRDYYEPSDSGQPRGSLNLPDLRQLKDLDFEEQQVHFSKELEAPSVQFSPLIATPAFQKNAAVGGLVAFNY